MLSAPSRYGGHSHRRGEPAAMQDGRASSATTGSRLRSCAVRWRLVLAAAIGAAGLAWEVVRRLGADHVVAVGNGANDGLMLEAAAIGVAVLGREGLAREAREGAHIVVPHINDALDLLLLPQRLIATLRR